MVVAITLLPTILSPGAIFVLAGPFIRHFYSDDFLPVINLVHVAAPAMFLYGCGVFLNRFLEAHGRGVAIRNSFILTGLSLLAANLILIPDFGPEGAAMAMVIASSIYLAAMVVSYKRRAL